MLDCGAMNGSQLQYPTVVKLATVHKTHQLAGYHVIMIIITSLETMHLRSCWLLDIEHDNFPTFDIYTIGHPAVIIPTRYAVFLAIVGCWCCLVKCMLIIKTATLATRSGMADFL